MNRLLLICCSILFLLTTQLPAQDASPFTYRTVFLRSDVPAKTALVTNESEERLEYSSPVMIAAARVENEKKFEYRSLLEFNYAYLPRAVITDPSVIYSAELILYPIDSLLSADDKNKPGQLIVKRVVQDWKDSMTVWWNQPPVDSSMQVFQFIKAKKKNDPVTVDVTQLVMAMLRAGNNGFMICHDHLSEQPIASGELFGSPRNTNENLRPVLVINYRIFIDRGSQRPVDLRPRPRQPRGGGSSGTGSAAESN